MPTSRRRAHNVSLDALKKWKKLFKGRMPFSIFTWLEFIFRLEYFFSWLVCLCFLSHRLLMSFTYTDRELMLYLFWIAIMWFLRIFLGLVVAAYLKGMIYFFAENENVPFGLNTVYIQDYFTRNKYKQKIWIYILEHNIVCVICLLE